MLQRGDIVVERLTAKRAIVIEVNSPEEVTCRFGDGRPEQRYVFELEPVVPLLGWLLTIFLGPLVSRSSERSSPSLGERVRPLLVRRS